MEHAHREREPEIPEPAAARAPVLEVLGAARVLALQRTAGNRAVAGMLARQQIPSAPAAPPVVTQALYDQAVALLASRNAELHRLLLQGRVGQTVRVRAVNLNDPSGATAQFTYDLQLTPRVSTGGALAEFMAIPPTPSGTARATTFAFLLDMRVSAPPAGITNPELRLAEYLFHEGLHMLLHMDRFALPGMPASGLLPQLAQFRALAAAVPAFSTLRQRMAGLIAAAAAAPAAAPNAASLASADRVIDGVLEERWAVDRQRAAFPGVPPANATLAAAYVPHYLRGEGVALASGNPQLAAVQGLMTQVLDALPPGAGAATPPAPSGAPTSPPPTGTPDAGPRDAGPRDAGPPDAGRRDAGG